MQPIKYFIKLSNCIATIIFLISVISHQNQIIAQNVLIDSSSVWKYLDDGSNQGEAWRILDFDDSNWSSGPGQFGYGDGDETTILSFGPDSSRPYATTYFRHIFNVDDPSQHVSLILDILYDDAAVVYLNGEELFTENLSTGHIIHFGTLARNPIDGEAEKKFTQKTVYPAGLIEGENLLAVEIHQSKYEKSIPDLSFDLRLASTPNIAVNKIEDLDSISHFRFAIMSDNKGDSPYKGNWGDKVKAQQSMQRLVDWTRNADFILGLGDHLVRADGSDPFLDFIRNDSHWSKNFYPNVADGENQAFGTGQDDWGAGRKIFNYLDNFWARENVIGQGNGVDYYVFFEKNGFTVHVISLHFSDSGPGLVEESRKFMEDRLNVLNSSKTEKDIILVLGHSRSGDFIKDANFNSRRKNLLLSTADLCVSATIHTFERYPDYNKQYPHGAVHYNSGSASQTGSTHGYMEMHVLENPTRLIIQYINLEDNTTRQLQTGYIEGIGDPTLALVKEINGPAYEITDWGSLSGEIVSLEIEEELPNTYSLKQNYPNPFNPSTIIDYQISTASNVKIEVFDTLGRMVDTLVDEYKNKGNYHVKFTAEHEKSGVYFYRMTAGNYSVTRKMLLVR